MSTIDTAHLPGPFHVVHLPRVTEVGFSEPHDIGTVRIIGGPNGEFAYTYGKRSEANARLIAASPDLLDALKSMLMSFEVLDEESIGHFQNPTLQGVIRGAFLNGPAKARAVIAKATVYPAPVAQPEADGR